MTLNAIKYALGVATLIFSTILVGCDSNDMDDADGAVSEIRILPDSASIEVGDEAEFSVVALTVAGETVDDADLDVRWWSSDSTVFTVEDDGSALGHVPGEAYCMVEVTDPSKAARFTGRDSAFVVVYLF